MGYETQGRSSKSFRPRKTKPTLKKLDKKLTKVQRELRPESKFCENSSTVLAITNVGTLNPLTQIPQGVDDQQRIGDELVLKNVLGRYVIKPAVGAIVNGGLPTNIRVVVFYYKASATPSPVVLDVLQIASPLSPLAGNNSQQIKIVYDNMMTLNQLIYPSAPDTGQLINGTFINDKMYKKLNLKYQYNLATDIEPKRNQLYVLFISDQNTHTIEYYFRSRYNDN